MVRALKQVNQTPHSKIKNSAAGHTWFKLTSQFLLLFLCCRVSFTLLLLLRFLFFVPDLLSQGCLCKRKWLMRTERYIYICIYWHLICSQSIPYIRVGFRLQKTGFILKQVIFRVWNFPQMLGILSSLEVSKLYKSIIQVIAALNISNPLLQFCRPWTL